MTYTFAAVSRRLAARLFATPPRPPGSLRVEHLEQRDVPAGTYTGFAFQDFNANGVRDVAPTAANTSGNGTTSLADDRGIAGVTVTAYAGSGQVAQTVTGATGAYTLTVAAPAAAGPYRIEFTGLPAGLREGPAGTDSKTTAQFVPDGGATNASVGLTRVGEYAQDVPLIVTTQYNFGDPATGANANAGAIVAFPSTAGGAPGSTNAQYTSPGARNVSIPYNRVGTVYGMGFDPFARNLYAGSYFKRHAGFGPGGTGTIYRANLPANVASLTNYQPAAGSLVYADLNAIFGANTAGANGHDTTDGNGNGLFDDYFSDNGNTGWAAVGTTGLGGLDVSDDGRFVFVMNLADRQLYRVPTSGPVNATTVTRVGIPLTNPDTTAITAARFRSADLRPFAVQFHRGEVYVGVVYTAQTLSTGPNDTTARNELVAAVYKLNPQTMQFVSTTPAFTARLNYPRAQSSILFDGADATVSPWRPWSAAYFNVSGTTGFGVAPQPMLSDISFDAVGNMTLGLRDRGADQIGNFNFSDPNNPTTEVEGFTTGDLLQAFITTPDNLNSGWTLENNGGGPAGQGTGPQNNNFGPGGAEFFPDEQLPGSHGETTIGGLLQLPGRPDVISAQMDPGSSTRAAGFSWMNTTSGREVKAFQIYATPTPDETTFSKANGIGGLAAVLDVAPLEVGNRVFRDSDRDGVQDPNEPVIAGVVVELVDVVTGNVISTATTATDGTYYFTSAAGTATASRRTGVPFVPGASYTVRVPNAVGATRQAPLALLLPTAADNGGADAGADLRDSDGAVVGTASSFTFVAGQPGENTHAIDFGFRTPGSTVAGLVYADANNDGLAAGDAVIAAPVQIRLTGTDVDGNAVNLTVTTVNGAYSFADVPPSNAAGYTLTQLTQPAGFLDGRDTPGTPFGGAGSGAAAGDTITTVVVPNNGTPAAGTGYNFAELLPASLGNFVWLDANGNGQQDATPAETAGVNGVTVVLSGTDDRGTVTPQTVTTAGGGLYGFTNLRPGNYTVTFGNTTGAGATLVTYTRTYQLTPAGLTVTDSNADRATGAAPAVTLAAGQSNPTIDAGLFLPVSLGDRVWFDTNGNGVENPGEPGIVGATVAVTYAGPDGDFATAGDNTVTTVTTGANGAYSLAGLAPGNYRVAVDPSAGTVNGDPVGPVNPTFDRDGTATPNVATVTLASGASVADADFGYANLPGAIGDLVWLDQDADGVRDANEPGLGGIAVTALFAGPDGDFATPADNTTYTTTTDATGAYSFPALPIGKFQVTVGTAGSNLTNTYDPDGPADGKAVVTLSLGAPTNLAVDFGVVGSAAVGDLVWYDADGNGTKNNAEPGIAGAVVTLRGAGADNVLNTADDLLLSATANATGGYAFPSLPVFGAGTPYRVTVAPPALYPAPTFDADGVGTANTSVVTLTPAGPGNVNLAQDFGYRGPLTQGLGDFVWLDANGNGRQDAGEAGVNGVAVTLLDAAGLVLATTTTANNPVGGAAGYYEFRGLATGNYSVRFGNTAAGVTYVRTRQDSAVATDATDSDASTTAVGAVLAGTTANVAIGVNEFNPTIDAGLYLPVSLGDTVYFDADGNGAQNNGEPGIVGATVTLVYAGPDGDFATTGDNVSATTVTAANGLYQFAGLAPGNYRVVIDTTGATVNGVPFSAPPTPSDDPDAGVPNGTADVALASGASNQAQDFGFTRLPGSLGDLVWLDLNKNGVFEAANGEKGLAGYTVTAVWAGVDNDLATAGDNKTYTTVTGANGDYLFTALPAGTYQVTIAAPAGSNLVNTFDLDSGTTAPDGKAVVTLVDTPAGKSRLDVDFGLAGTAKIGDLVWYDVNGDGVRGANEPGIAGATVILRGAGADNVLGNADDFFVTTSTDSAGFYRFDNLPTLAGGTNYSVTVTPPAQFPAPTYDKDGTGTANVSTTTLTGSQFDAAQDFGYRGPLNQGLGDFVWLDGNGNGRQDAGEAGVNGVAVDLLDAAGNVLASTTTGPAPVGGAPGYYEFRGLATGTYSVRFGNTAGGVTYTRTLQASPAATAATDSDASAATGQTVATVIDPGEFDPTIDAGLYLPVSLGDRVWFDTNGNGTQDAGEPGIVGATVTVTYAGPDGAFGGADDALVTVTATGADGVYVLSGLTPGNYRVTVDPSTGTVNGNPVGPVSATFDLDSGTASPDGVSTQVVLSGQNPRGVDFGYANFPGSLGDRVWLDRNANGVQDAGEPGLVGVAVTAVWAGPDGDFATAGDNKTYTTVTGADGAYGFPALPLGQFRVTANTAGTNLSNTFDLDGGLDNTALVTLTFAAPARPDVDFGVVGAASVGDLVWFDADNNGSKNNAEPGIAGATVTIRGAGADGVPGNADDLVLTTVTDANGAYTFTGLPTFPGGTRYEVAVTPTAKYPTPVFDADGAGTPNVSAIVLSGAQTSLVQDFGYQGPLTQGLGDFVWLDGNGNGRQDAGEAGVNGVAVDLLDAAGNVLASTTTANNPVGGAPGYYEFRGLPAGNYSVRFGNTAAGVTYTRTLQGSPAATAADDSNASPTTGQTASITLPAGTFDPTIDAGLYLPVSLGDRVWFDTNANGVQDTGEPSITDATVTVTYAGPDGNFGTGDDTATTVTTDGAGLYVLSGLTPGNYRVAVDVSTGKVAGVPVGTVSPTFDLDSGTTNPDSKATLTILSNQNPRNVDFGYVNFPGALGDRVWLDRDSDGVQDANEPGLVGVAVSALWAGPDGDFATAGDNFLYTTVTGADGAYSFPTLPLGKFQVTIGTAGSNLTPTFDLDGGPDNTALVTLTTGTPVRPDVDFGVVGAASVGDLVWYDVDGDGVRGANEPGISGATVTLTGAGADGVLGNADDLTLSTVTDVTGGYAFPSLPVFGAGTPYRVTVTPPVLYPAQTSDADGVGTPNASTVTLAPNAADTLQDFGYRGPLTQGLGDFVWLDANGNGRQDAGETGVDGVTVELLDAAGNVLVSTTTGPAPGTGAPGYYEFRGLAAGTYSVRFGNAAAGVTYVRTQQSSPVAAGGDDSNASAVTGQTNPIALPANTFDPTIDAGLYLPAALGDTVWFDADRNGVQNGAEPGLANVTITLDYAGPDGVFGGPDDVLGVATTATNAAGQYLFPNLRPGTYRVTVAPNTLPAGLTAPTADLDGVATANTATAAITSGQTRPDADFGYVGTASLGDTVWYDFDRNGVQNNNEPGVAGVSVTLTWAGPNGAFGDADDFVFAAQTTDAQGRYLFSGLPAGQYRAAVTASTLPAGVPVNTFDLDSGTAGANGTADTTLAAGQDRRDVDFGYAGTGSIGDTVYSDTNGDGVQNPGEPGIPGVPVGVTWAGPDNTLGTPDDVTRTVTTTAAGTYTFAGLPPGTHTIAVLSPQPGTTPSGDPDGVFDNQTTVVLTPNQTVTAADFGYQGIGTLGGTVFVDSDRDGVRDAGEPGLPGVVVTLTGTDANGNPVTQAATTNAAGQYLFTNLQPGTYTLTETQPGLYGDGTDRAGTVGGVPAGTAGNDAIAGIVIGPFQAGINYDFGEVGGTITGTVFNDRDSDGVRDPGEPGTPGVVVTVRTPNGTVIGTATTGPDGTYTIADLPAGPYTVTETQPAGTGDPATGPAAPNTRTVGVTPGGTVAGVDFGDTFGTLSGTVFVDANNDGVRGAGEPTIPNVTLVLLDGVTGAALATTTTDGNGFYQFTDLVAGPYSVVELQPAGFLDGQDTPGTRGGVRSGPDGIAGIPVPAGGAAPGNDFGEIVPSTVAGSIFADTDRDGVRDSGEPGIPNVTVRLVDAAGTVVGTAVTDAAGNYLFTNVSPGTYTVEEVQPGGLGTTPNTGGDVRTVTVAPGSATVAVNFPDTLGTIAGSVYRDNDLSGTRSATPPPDAGIAGVTVTLLDGAGNVVAVTTTDGLGNYRFTGLPAGTYTVVETQPGAPTADLGGFYDGFDRTGNFGGTSPVKNSIRLVLPAGADATGYEFGELPPADPFGFVYVDINRDGVPGPNEPGIPGVAITISGTAFPGTPFARPLTAADVPGGLTIRTDANGEWRFTPIPPGVYTFTEAQPAGYADGAEQSLDTVGPNAARVGNDEFGDVLNLPASIRGPFNFGEFLAPATGPLAPIDFFPRSPTSGVTDRPGTKREFLGSTSTAAAADGTTQADTTQATSPNFNALAPTPTYLAVAEDVGGGMVRVFDYQSGIERFRFRPFGDFSGGVHVATGDVTGDGVPDIVVTPGAGGGPIVRVYDGLTGNEIANIMAFEETFRGGLQLAVGDTDGDGRADIIVAPDVSGGPIVRAFDGRTFRQTANFFALDETFRGGLRLAAGDINRDGRADVIVTAGVGGGPRVAGYDGSSLGLTNPPKLFGDFFAFAPELRSGFYASTGDVDGDGFADVVLGAGPGGGPRVAAYSGRSLTTGAGPQTIADVFAGDPESRAGVRVKAADLDGDGRAEIVAVPGAGVRPVAFIVDPLTGRTRDEFLAFPTDFLGGVTVG